MERVVAGTKYAEPGRTGHSRERQSALPRRLELQKQAGNQAMQALQRSMVDELKALAR